MTSFLLKESIYFAKENGSKLYTCFLDVKKVFDQVWHNGLFYKLYHAGLDKAILKVLIILYSDVSCCVKNHGIKSGWFKILQGTGQGRVNSQFAYLMYINGLMYELENSKLSFWFIDISCSCPTVADDMLLVSFSKASLDQMLRICYDYSAKWRYLYSVLKQQL